MGGAAVGTLAGALIGRAQAADCARAGCAGYQQLTDAGGMLSGGLVGLPLGLPAGVLAGAGHGAVTCATRPAIDARHPTCVAADKAAVVLVEDNGDGTGTVLDRSTGLLLTLPTTTITAESWGRDQPVIAAIPMRTIAAGNIVIH